MSIIIENNHIETAEVEFSGRHPDIFSSYLAAELVKELSSLSDKKGYIKRFRADLNVQSSVINHKNSLPIIRINICGQLIIPKGINLYKICRKATIKTLRKAGYFKTDDFSQKRVIINIEGITAQSPELNKTTNSNKFADSCVVYGHYIKKPFGINGTFPSLMIAKKIDECIKNLSKNISELRPDGKVHVTVKYRKDGFIIKNIYISISHKKGVRGGFKKIIKKEIKKELKDYLIKRIEINSGGNFDVYFLNADSGISKAKDDVIITGGIHQLGTDGVWGKCLCKASSTLIPYVFSLSRLVCDMTNAKYASVSAFSAYGKKYARLQLQDIDSDCEIYRKEINLILKRLPRDRDSIRKIINLTINERSYKLFNDIRGFHDIKKPWKRNNKKLNDIIIKFKSNKNRGLYV